MEEYLLGPEFKPQYYHPSPAQRTYKFPGVHNSRKFLPGRRAAAIYPSGSWASKVCSLNFLGSFSSTGSWVTTPIRITLMLVKKCRIPGTPQSH